jgi:hypothetical protein
MAKNQREVEDALFQIKNLEESLQRNAQGILSSTMREEINSLVKESLKEQDEVEDEEEVEVDIEDTDTDNEEFTDDDEYAIDNMGDEEMMGQEVMPSDDDTVDLTQASDSEVLRVFRAMGDNDGVIVKRDDNMIHLSDNENNAEYIIQLSESMDDMGDMPRMMSRKSREMEEMDMGNMSSYEDEEDDFEDDDFENLSFGSEDDEDEDEFGDYMPMNKLDMGIREKGMLNQDPMGGKFQSNRFDDEEGFDDEFDYMSLGEEEEALNPEQMAYAGISTETTENIYELELDDEDGMFDEEDFSNEEKYHSMMEAKGFKAKGVGMGNASKYRMSKKPNMDGGFKTVKKTANKTMGTGRPKFEYKEGENLKGDFNVKPSRKKMETPSKMETKEASRTYGNGSKSGRGLRKGITPNRNLTLENKRELELLRGKNDEYRKALDLFRTKLNEVAVFNSNLAYATRLFTEHSTTKQEKINILRRFDNAETLKESKNLYRTLKSELDSPKASENTITESVQRRVEITPSTGSAANLIESKTYENPQFLRMKDLMTKIK